MGWDFKTSLLLCKFFATLWPSLEMLVVQAISCLSKQFNLFADPHTSPIFFQPFTPTFCTPTQERNKSFSESPGVIFYWTHTCRCHARRSDLKQFACWLRADAASTYFAHPQCFRGLVLSFFWPRTLQYVVTAVTTDGLLTHLLPCQQKHIFFRQNGKQGQAAKAFDPLVYSIRQGQQFNSERLSLYMSLKLATRQSSQIHRRAGRAM